MNVDDVRAAVTRVLGDLGADTRIDVDLVEDGLTQFVFPDGGTHASRVEFEAEVDLLVAAADVIQNDVNFWLPGAWGEALPPCPGHPHPMNPRVLDDAAWWTCPSTGDPVAEIGTLPSRGY